MSLRIDADKIDRFFVDGDTYFHRDALMQLGGVWNPKKRVWTFSPNVFFKVEEYVMRVNANERERANAANANAGDQIILN